MSGSEYEFELSDGPEMSCGDDSDFELENKVVAVNKGPAKATKAAGSKGKGKAQAKGKSRGKGKAKPKAATKSFSEDEDEEEDAANGNWGNRRNSVEKAQLSKKFQKKTQLEHIMLRPDTYIGSVEKCRLDRWVFDSVKERMVYKSIEYVPGLYKIFDEILVNAADNKQRDASMRGIKVTISEETGEISVWNDGKGIPIELHQEHNIYIPELVFGHLLTGENFEDTQQRVVGGRNGYGAKLANIFSKKFTVETSDGRSGQTYTQTWTENMAVAEKPKITASKSKKEYTKVTFIPDYERFGMPDGLDTDTIALLKKRVFDIAGVTDKSVKVSLNGKLLPVHTFEKYIDLYYGFSVSELSKSKKKKKSSDSEDSDVEMNEKEEEDPEVQRRKALPKIYEKINDRWEICVTCSQGQFEQVSFVNSICTMNGGQHVNNIADQISKRLVEVVKKKVKGMDMKPFQIKNHLCVFVNALIVNPAFDSQTKETLTTVPSKFGPAEFKPKLSDKTLKKIDKCGLVDNVVYWAKAKSMKDLARKAGGKKTKVSGIDKLDDANKAGSRESHKCTLILTEGDSAKTLAISGLSIVGRDYYGVFPLKGKLLNVRDAGHSQIMKNTEIQNIMKIMGLTPGKEYDTVSKLRYGHIMIMTDQDHDGSHIKGLLINFIHHFWPKLLTVPGFLQVFITPIVKAVKGNQTKSFYTMPEYEEWCESVGPEVSRWKIKYYKGLGTSTAKEAKEYFADLPTHQIDMVWEGTQAGESIEMAFSKKKIKERKQWLAAYEPGTCMDFNVEEIQYTDFVNKELILFSIADNERSIPCVVDGLKPSQRKVLFACFKRKLKNEIKVAQLAGYTSEHSSYHHGEVSLSSTITGMAQDFIGSNNINFLFPSGQFGTRILGGKDAASPRYIFTRLAKITRHVFNEKDDPLLTYLNEEGQKIEPVWYIPLIPTLLVNGASGIGTGWSTDIPCFNPRDLVKATRRLLIGCEPEEKLQPWYRDYDGIITPEVHAKKGLTGRYIVRGKFERIEPHTIAILELPVGTWTQNYKTFLEDQKHFPQGQILDLREYHTDVTVHFEVDLSEEFYATVATDAALIKRFKLETTVSTSNMVAFDQNGVIKSYSSPEEILKEFFQIRLDFYEKRKRYMENSLEKEWMKLDNKARFVYMVASGEIVLIKRKKPELVAELNKLGFLLIEDTFDYLLDMKIQSITLEQVEKLQQQRDEKRQELIVLQGKSKEDLYTTDLDEFLEALDANDEEAQIEREKQIAQQTKRAGKKGKKPKLKAKARAKPAVKREKKAATSKPKAIVEKESSVKVAPKEEPQPADDSLAARLARRMNTTKAEPKEADDELTETFKKMVVTPIADKANKPKKRGKAKISTPVSLVKPQEKKHCAKDTPEVVAPRPRQRRAATKKSYVDLVDSDEKEESEVEFVEDDDSSAEEESEDDSEYSE